MRKFDQFSRHNLKLAQANDVLAKYDPNGIEYEYAAGGLTSKFELQLDLAWKVLKELMEAEGIAAAQTGSPRMIFKEAYKVYDFIDENIWLEMLNERNHFTRTYEDDLLELIAKICNTYIPAFIQLEADIQNMYGDELDKLE